MRELPEGVRGDVPSQLYPTERAERTRFDGQIMPSGQARPCQPSKIYGKQLTWVLWSVLRSIDRLYRQVRAGISVRFICLQMMYGHVAESDRRLCLAGSLDGLNRTLDDGSV